jgi:hypothetical protein
MASIQIPVQMETPTNDSPSGDWHLINRYEGEPGWDQRMIEVEPPSASPLALTAEQARDLAVRLIRHATILDLDTPAGP